ncbi:MAG: JmjC domain-containing protein, partial [Povalibacter sp.]
WRLFSPTLPLPLSHQTSDRSDVPCPPVPQIDCVLESGDVLYVPRGWWHQVTPLEEGSLHFSIGVYAPTTQDYLAWLCSRVVPQSIAGRAAVDAITQEQMTALLQTLSAAAADPSLRAEFNQSLATKEVLTAEFNTELFLNRRMPLLVETARLRLTTRQTPDEQGRLSVHGAVLQLDRTGAAIVRMLAAAGDRTFAEIARQLREIPREAVHRSLLDLMGREILTLD